MEETWKDIAGYEGIYQVSNFGRIKNFERIILVGGNKNTIRTQKEHIKTQHINDKKYTYYKTDLYKNNIRKTYKVHRLVATAFIPNPENKPEVNHIDGNPSNNNLENLEWCTASENRQHSFDKLGRKNAKGSESKNSIPVCQISLDGFLMNVFGSRIEAYKETGVHGSRIVKCARKETKTAGGFIWM